MEVVIKVDVYYYLGHVQETGCGGGGGGGGKVPSCTASGVARYISAALRKGYEEEKCQLNIYIFEPSEIFITGMSTLVWEKLRSSKWTKNILFVTDYLFSRCI